MRGKKLDVKGLIKDILPIFVLVSVMIVATILLWPHIQKLTTEEGRDAFKDWVDDLGFGGWLVTLGLQLLQVFVALIPSEPIELILGYVWGPWLGAITCLIGIFISSLIIFLLVRKLGTKFVGKMIGEKELSKYKFLSDTSKLEITVFLFFFIPGTPKDAMTYIAPIAPINPVRYLTIGTLARIPSIISSTIVGDTMAEGKWIASAIIFGVTAVVSIAGIIFSSKFMAKRNAKAEANLEEQQSENCK